jgi:hypothetical protein
MSCRDVSWIKALQRKQTQITPTCVLLFVVFENHVECTSLNRAIAQSTYHYTENEYDPKSIDRGL